MIDKDGYIRHYPHDHPYRGNRVRIFEHVMVMERLIERPIRPDEVVHHINGVRTDNDVGNLELMNRGRHQSITASRRKRDGRGRFR